MKNRPAMNISTISHTAAKDYGLRTKDRDDRKMHCGYFFINSRYSPYATLFLPEESSHSQSMNEAKKKKLETLRLGFY